VEGTTLRGGDRVRGRAGGRVGTRRRAVLVLEDVVAAKSGGGVRPKDVTSELDHSDVLLRRRDETAARWYVAAPGEAKYWCQ
jgi:hypothetical protein